MDEAERLRGEEKREAGRERQCDVGAREREGMLVWLALGRRGWQRCMMPCRPKGCIAKGHTRLAMLELASSFWNAASAWSCCC